MPPSTGRSCSAASCDCRPAPPAPPCPRPLPPRPLEPPLEPRHSLATPLHSTHRLRPPPGHHHPCPAAAYPRCRYAREKVRFNTKGHPDQHVLSHFWAAHQRFFRALCMSIKVRRLPPRRLHCTSSAAPPDLPPTSRRCPRSSRSCGRSSPRASASSSAYRRAAYHPHRPSTAPRPAPPERAAPQRSLHGGGGRARARRGYRTRGRRATTWTTSAAPRRW